MILLICGIVVTIIITMVVLKSNNLVKNPEIPPIETGKEVFPVEPDFECGKPYEDIIVEEEPPTL